MKEYAFPTQMHQKYSPCLFVLGKTFLKAASGPLDGEWHLFREDSGAMTLFGTLTHNMLKKH